MLYYFSFNCVVLLVLCKLKLKVYHPLIITFLIWLLTPVAYIVFPSGLYKLTDRIWSVLFLYLAFFLFGSFSYYVVFGKRKKSMEIVYENKTNLFHNFLFFLTVYLFFRYSLLIVKGTTLYKLIVQKNLPLDLKLLFYIDKISLAYFFYIVSKNKIATKEKHFAVLFCVTYMLKFSKMDIMSLFVGTVLALWNNRKIKLKHIFFSFFVMFGLLCFLHFFRVKDNSSTDGLFDAIGKMLAIYFLSPLKAFDMLVNETVSMSNGRTFVLVINIVRKVLGINLVTPTKAFDGWVYVPYPTNVYTCLYPFYSDFKIAGVIVFGIILGFFWTFIYERRYKKSFDVIYIALFYILVFQFFSDILFSYASGCIQLIFWSFVVVKLKRSKKIAKGEVNDGYFNFNL